MNTTTEIYYRKTGTRTILATDWPVATTVNRMKIDSRVAWVVAWGLCNGVATDSETFFTRREALAAAEMGYKAHRDIAEGMASYG